MPLTFALLGAPRPGVYPSRDPHIVGNSVESASGCCIKDATRFDLLLAAAIALGIAIRAVPVLGTDFPLTDGGLFLVVIETIRGGHYQLPSTVDYNGMDLPFAYPPLGFYLAAFIADLVGTSPLDLLRYIPLVTSIATLLAFAWGADRGLHSRVATLCAVTIFAVAPGAYVSLLMGGGLTRGLGFLFVVLALGQVHAMFTTGRRVSVVLCALFSGLALFSHPAMAWFLAFSTGVLLLAFGRNVRGIVFASIAAAGAGLIVLPWILVALRVNGPDVFLAAFQKGSLFVGGAAAQPISSEQFLATAALIVGIVVCLLMAGSRHRGLFMLAWIGLIVLLAPRELTRVTILPVSLAAGEIVGRIAGGIRPGAALAIRVPVSPRHLVRRWGGWVVVGVVALALWPVIVSLLTDRDGFVALSPRERAAMEWVKDSTAQSGRFLIVSGHSWPRDRVVEWFPVLAQRVSVVTPQGTEWTTDGRFARLNEASALAQACADESDACIDRWEQSTRLEFDYVYIASDGARGCCPVLTSSLRSDSRYHSVYDEPSASIFARGSAPR